MQVSCNTAQVCCTALAPLLCLTRATRFAASHVQHYRSCVGLWSVSATVAALHAPAWHMSSIRLSFCTATAWHYGHITHKWVVAEIGTPVQLHRVVRLCPNMFALSLCPYPTDCYFNYICCRLPIDAPPTVRVRGSKSACYYLNKSVGYFWCKQVRYSTLHPDVSSISW